MKAALFFLFFSSYFGIHMYAQSNTPSNLKEWDSVAFAALEGNKENALTIAEKFKDAALKKKPGIYLVNAYTILGILNKDKGYYISSLNNYLKALNAAETIHDLPRISACYNNIGQIYYLQQNYSRAKEFYTKALDIENALPKSDNNSFQKSIRFYNLGEVYLQQDSFDIALTYFNNSLQIEQRLKSDEGVMYALLGLSEVYIEIDRLTDAEISLDHLKAFDMDPYPKVSSRYWIIKGLLNLRKDNYAEALSQLDKAETLSKKFELKIYLEEIYTHRIAALQKMGNWQKLSESYAVYISLLEELNNTKVKNQLEDLTYQNEIDKRDLEIKLVGEQRDLANKQAVTASQTADYEQKIVWFLLLSLVGLIVLILYGIRKITQN